MTKKTILKIFIFSCVFTNISIAQEYKAAYGLKAGVPGFFAFNAKNYLGRHIALDSYVGTNIDFDKHFVNLNATLTYNKPIGIATGFSWYAGLGPTAQYYTKGENFDDDKNLVYSPFAVRTDAVLGMEVNPKDAKFNIAVEAGPTFLIIPYTKLSGTINLSVKFPLKKKANYITHYQ